MKLTSAYRAGLLTGEERNLESFEILEKCQVKGEKEKGRLNIKGIQYLSPRWIVAVTYKGILYTFLSKNHCP